MSIHVQITKINAFVGHTRDRGQVSVIKRPDEWMRGFAEVKQTDPY